MAPANDIHANVVADHVAARASVAYLDLHSFVTQPVEVVPGELIRSGGDVVAREGSTVWWRRTGRIAPDNRMGNAENRLRCEEARAQLVGGLLSLPVHWVDHPGAVDTAEHTLLQLQSARQCDATVPDTVVTNQPDLARTMARTHQLVAKSISSGIGIAPFVDSVDQAVMDLLPNAPTLLQQRITGEADLRVVSVGRRAYVWRRRRVSGEPVDWRHADPNGRAFEPTSEASVAELAVRITHRLGLTFSAQDWVETAGGHVFLEANPVGQWLFLADADAIIGAALAEHLLAQGCDD